MDLDRIRNGDLEALGELIDGLWVPLVRYLRTVVDSDDSAEDVAQEALVRLWANRDRWTGNSTRALLFRIARNIAIDKARRAGVHQAWVKSSLRSPIATPATPEQEHQEAELARAFETAIESLPERRREVFELVRLKMHSYREVSEILEISEQTVANHMSLAMTDLREQLSAFLPHDRTCRNPGNGGTRDG